MSTAGAGKINEALSKFSVALLDCARQSSPPSVVARISPLLPNAQPFRLSTNTILLSCVVVPLACRIQCVLPLSSDLRITPSSPQAKTLPFMKYWKVPEEYPQKTLRSVFETPLVSGVQVAGPLLTSIAPFWPTTQPVSSAKNIP